MEENKSTNNGNRRLMSSVDAERKNGDSPQLVVGSIPWYKENRSLLEKKNDFLKNKVKVPEHAKLYEEDLWSVKDIEDVSIGRFCPSRVHHGDKPVLAVEFLEALVTSDEKYMICVKSGKSGDLYKEIEKDFYGPSKETLEKFIFHHEVQASSTAAPAPASSNNYYSMAQMNYGAHAMGATTRDTQNVVTNNNGIDGTFAQRMGGGSVIPPSSTNNNRHAQVPQDGARPPVMNANSTLSLPEPASMQRIRQPSGGVPPSLNPQQFMPSRPLPASVETTPSLGANNPGQGAPTQLPQQPQQQHPSIDASFESVGENNTSFQSFGPNSSFERGAGDLSFSSAPSEIRPSSAANPFPLQQQNVQAATGQPAVNESQSYTPAPHSQASIAATLAGNVAGVVTSEAGAAPSAGDTASSTALVESRSSNQGKYIVNDAAKDFGNMNLRGKNSGGSFLLPQAQHNTTTNASVANIGGATPSAEQGGQMPSFPQQHGYHQQQPTTGYGAAQGPTNMNGAGYQQQQHPAIENGAAYQQQQYPTIGNGASYHPQYQQQQPYWHHPAIANGPMPPSQYPQQPYPHPPLIENGAASNHQQQHQNNGGEYISLNVLDKFLSREDKHTQELLGVIRDNQKALEEKSEKDREAQAKKEDKDREAQAKKEDKDREALQKDKDRLTHLADTGTLDAKLGNILETQEKHGTTLAGLKRQQNRIQDGQDDILDGIEDVQEQQTSFTEGQQRLQDQVASIPPPSPAMFSTTPLRSFSQAGMHTPASRVSAVGALFPPVEDDLPVNPESDKCDGLVGESDNFCTYRKKSGSRYCGQHQNFPEKYAARMRRKRGGGRR